VIRWAVSLALLISAPAIADEPRDPRGSATIAADADPGGRKLSALAGPLKAAITKQRFGARWVELLPKGRRPKSGGNQGKAKTHPDLEADEIEMQAQAQFLEETGVEVRYGLVSIRMRRVFRFGRLVAVQLTVDRIGRGAAKKAVFDTDLAALEGAWKDPIVALGLEKGYKLVRNDLAKRAAKLPLLIEIEPPDRS